MKKAYAMLRATKVRLVCEHKPPIACVLSTDIVAVVAVHSYPTVSLPWVVQPSVKPAFLLPAARQPWRLLWLSWADQPKFGLLVPLLYARLLWLNASSRLVVVKPQPLVAALQAVPRLWVLLLAAYGRPPMRNYFLQVMAWKKHLWVKIRPKV